MGVMLISWDSDPTPKICELVNIFHPTIKTTNLNAVGVRRIVRRLIRNRDVILRSSRVLFRLTCPIFVMTELNQYMNYIPFINLDYNLSNISFYIPDEFEDTQKQYLFDIFKQIKLTIKSSKKEMREYIIYMLPHLTIISFDVYLDFLDIFDVITKINTNNVNSQTSLIIDEMYNLINIQFPYYFTRQHLEIYSAN